MKSIILGSNSPRRKELLAGLGFEFTVDTGNNFDECIEDGVDPHQQVIDMSEGKSLGFHRELKQDEILITADTIVIVDDELLGKPHSRQEAVCMLQKLSGREHEVVTAVTIRDASRKLTFSDSSKVVFAPLSDSEIDYYIDNYKPFDKAGAYGIQEWIGYAAIESIAGSFYNIMGLPVHRIYQEIKSFL